MKKDILKPIFLFILLVLVKLSLYGQVDSERSGELDRLKMLMNLIRPTVVDVNRVPINVCFIELDEKYVGFIIAGHASKNVCEVATLQVQNFLDSVGHTENTIFSFGVGFDLCGSRDSEIYDDKLRDLEKSFTDLQREFFLEVSVSYVADSVFKKYLNMIRDNMNLAFDAMSNKDSVNRIIFRYKNASFPIPVPFYAKDGIVRFTIPKNEIGRIPAAKSFGIGTLDNALKEIAVALDLNTKALANLKLYDPYNYSRFAASPYIINSFYMGKVNRDTFLLPTVVSENSSVSFWSLAQLRAKCNAGEGETIEVIGQTRKITPCKALARINEEIVYQAREKDLLIDLLTQTNGRLKKEKDKVLKFRSEFVKKNSSGDSIILVDAFLRGWCFKSGDPVIETQLSNWYKKREAVWKNILAKKEDYRKVLETKKTLPKDPKNIVTPSANNKIAGIFHSDDVFFSVKDNGKDYIVTPYKMLSGNFVQVIDKKNSVCQFVSENNFRLLKL